MTTIHRMLTVQSAQEKEEFNFFSVAAAEHV